ncbi:MAG: hypothetical protein H6Q99_292 [Proteobacteria bacterium]|nr:hypothetical protein [Pseudomonadota bacterium]
MTATVSIPHVAWRDGRPRFVPAKGLRARGYKGKDLKHPDGQWFTFEEARRWSAMLVQEMEDKPEEVAEAVAPAAVYSLGGMITDWLVALQLQGKKAKNGAATEKPLSPETIKDYTKKTGLIEKDYPAQWQEEAAKLTKSQARGLYKKILEKRGLSQASGVMRSLSACYTWATEERPNLIKINPCYRLKLQTPGARLRAGSREEIGQFIAAADLLERPDMGDMIALGAFVGQRQKDRLAMQWPQVKISPVKGEVIEIRQSKTGAVIEVKIAGPLSARLREARRRHAALKPRCRNIAFDERTCKPWNASHYRHEIARIRSAAANGIVDDEATAVAREGWKPTRRSMEPPTVWKLDPMPSIADLTDQDLRDTAFTWLARAGATDSEIAAVTGHSPATIAQMKKHYLAIHPEMAAHAVDKLDIWWRGNGDLTPRQIAVALLLQAGLDPDALLKPEEKT